jgi:hypothetical protein
VAAVFTAAVLLVAPAMAADSAANVKNAVCAANPTAKLCLRVRSPAHSSPSEGRPAACLLWTQPQPLRRPRRLVRAAASIPDTASLARAWPAFWQLCLPALWPLNGCLPSLLSLPQGSFQAQQAQQ